MMFDEAEYTERLAKVQAAMAAAELAALVVVDPANLFYLSGYNAWSFYTPQCLIVPASGGPQLFARAMDAAGAHWTARLPDDAIHGYPETLVQRPDVHPFQWIAERARQVGVLPAAGRIGFEADAHHFTPRAYLTLVAGLPGAELVDCEELVNWVRVVKSSAEQELLRQVGANTDVVMRQALDLVQVGRRQCDVAAQIMAAQACGTPGLGGDYPAIVPMLPTGVSAGTPHLTWSDRPFIEGEATTIELSAAAHRYHVPLARTVMLGPASRQLANTAAVVAEGLRAALDAIRPGATGASPHRAFTEVINRQGLTKESRIGYSIGIGYPPDWGERTMSLRAEEDRELLPGMAFHMILGMWMDGWGYEVSESLLVTDQGCEPLTHLPYELTVKS